MRAVSSLLVAVAPLLSVAAPLRRTADSVNLLVMNFANTLEQLESQFYQAAISKFTDSDFQQAGYTSTQVVVEQLQSIQSDEDTHQKILSNSIPALGGSVLQGCTFNFDSLLTDVATTMATARIVENLGVSAYLGAAHLLTDPQLLEAAGSILSVEARHQTILNIFAGTSTVIPQAFDIALSPSEILAVASPFISGCDLGIPANPTLSITNTGPVTPGTLLTFSSSALPSDTSNLNCHMIIGGAVNSISLPYSACTVPETVNGPVAIWITNDTQPLLNNVVDRDTSDVLIAGPIMTFIDAKMEALPQLVRTSSSSSNGTSTTESISPAQASGIASSDSSSNSTDSSSNSTTSSSNSTVSTPGGPDLTTGNSADGTMTVNGFMNLPPST